MILPMMVGDGKPFDMSKELAALQHDRKNQSLKKLPQNTSMSRRPLSHPAVAPPQASAQVQKVVYVSCRTPVMSAVKRVKKLLRHVEKRALQSIETKDSNKAQFTSNLMELSERLAKNSEEILVKASGRAMEQALRIGEWFRTKETEFMCNVEVRTSSVPAIDDLVFNDKDDLTQSTGEGNLDREADSKESIESGDVTVEEGSTTMDILGDQTTSTAATTDHNSSVTTDASMNEKDAAGQAKERDVRRRRRKRKREVYDGNDMPEARVRWVKTVEIAISLKA